MVMPGSSNGGTGEMGKQRRPAQRILLPSVSPLDDEVVVCVCVAIVDGPLLEVVVADWVMDAIGRSSRPSNSITESHAASPSHLVNPSRTPSSTTLSIAPLPSYATGVKSPPLSRGHTAPFS